MKKLITQIKRLALALCLATPCVSWAAAVGDTVTWTNADGLTADDVVNANHCSFSLQLPATESLPAGSVVRITNVQFASINSARVSNSGNNQNDPHSIAIGATRSSEVSFITSETLAGKYIDSYDFSNGVEVEVGKEYGESWGAYYTQFGGCGITFLHSNGNRWSGGTTMNCTVGGTTSGAIANGNTVFPIYKITATVVAVAQNVERTIAANANTTWDAAEWTVGGVADQSFEPDSDTIYNVTVTVGGDCTVTMPESMGSFRTCNINFVLDGSAEAANVTLNYPGTLPSDSATTANFSPFGAASVTAGEGVTLTPTYDGDTEGYVTKADGVNYYVAKRSDVGVVSVRIGARTAAAAGGNIDPSYSNVGPYPLSGMLWNQTKLWNNNSTSGTYTDIQNLKDAKDGSSSVRIAYYGHNTYFNSNAATSPNMVLTKTYLDDSDSGNGNLTATDGEEEITLPTPGHVRGWQLHFDNIPYNAYDVYFITASDVENGNLKETPIYVSLDGGSTWKSYCGDSVNQKTVMGTDNWTGLPYAEDGVLVHGKNYIKMRITKSIYGDNIGTIDITHGVRNTGSSIRSGLAAIQIVEVQNDGVYTLQESGNWSGAVWSVGSLTDQTWTDTVEGEASIAKIASSETVSSVNVDAAVSAGSVVLTGSDPFTVAGSSTLTVDTGFDASAFTGSLNLQAPIAGTIYIGANTDLEFGGNTDMTLPAYTLDGAGAWQKVGSGKLTVNNPLTLAGTVNDGTVEFTSSTSGSLSLVGGNLVLAGGETELIYSGVASLADEGTGKTVVSSGVVQSTGRIETDIDVEDGAKLKLGALRGFGSGGTSVGSTPSGKTITIKQGGTIELNGTEGCNEYTLAGGTLQNSGNAIAVTQRQTMGLTLTDDSTVNAASNFGLVNNGYAAVTVTLNGNTLTKTGANTFILCNVATDNSGAIAVAEGTMAFQGSASTVSAPVTVAQGAALNVAIASSVADVAGAGSVTGTATLTVTGELDLADGLAVSAPVALADGATVTFASASTITGTIASPASGTATLDVSAIIATEPTEDVTLATAATGLDVTALALAAGTPEGYTLEVVDDSLKLMLPVTSVTVTVPEVANTTVTVEVGGETIGTAAGDYDVEPDSVVTVTYAAAEGYQISGTTVYTIDTATATTFDPSETTQVAQIVAQIRTGATTYEYYTTLAGALASPNVAYGVTLRANIDEDEVTVSSPVMITGAYTISSDIKVVDGGQLQLMLVTMNGTLTIEEDGIYATGGGTLNELVTKDGAKIQLTTLSETAAPLAVTTLSVEGDLTIISSWGSAVRDTYYKALSYVTANADIDEGATVGSVNEWSAKVEAEGDNTVVYLAITKVATVDGVYYDVAQDAVDAAVASGKPVTFLVAPGTVKLGAGETLVVSGATLPTVALDDGLATPPYEVVQTVDGEALTNTYAVKAYVAQITRSEYSSELGNQNVVHKFESLRDAVAAANAGETIVMIYNDTVSFANGGVVIDKNLTINGANFTVYGKSEVGSGNIASPDQINADTACGFYITGGNVTFQNITLTEFGDTDYLNKFGRVPVLTSTSYNGALTLTNVNINKFNRQAVCSFGGTLVITGGTYNGNATLKGVDSGSDYFQQPIEVRGGTTATITGVTVCGGGSNVGFPAGGIVVFSGASTTIENADIDFTGYSIWVDNQDQTNPVVVRGSDTAVSGTSAAVFVEDSSALSIEAGTFTGALTTSSATDTISITGGTFSVDPRAYVASGYAATESAGVWTVGPYVPPAGIDPESNVLSTTVTAAVGASDADVWAVTTLKVPTGAAVEAGTYKGYFTYTVASGETEGTYTVTITGVKEEVVEDADEAAIDTLVGSGTTVAVKPGLYYAFVPGETPVIEDPTELTLATTTSMDVTRPTGTGKGFFKVVVSPTQITATP